MSIDIDKFAPCPSCGSTGTEHSLNCREYRQPRAPSPQPVPTPMLLWCPDCGARHVDKGDFAHKAHHTHACQHCGMVWRPALIHTVGVQFLPGFRDSKDDL